jgi:Fe-S oxidoreductase
MCRHVCPVGHVTQRESFTPHGWTLTIASVERGQIDWNDSSVALLYSCADCGTCRANCVTDQPLPDAIAAARAGVVALGRAPEAVARLESLLQQFGNPYSDNAPLPPTGPAAVALFVGDDAAHLRPAALEAALRLLNAAGIEPALVGRGRSSGYLAASLGLPDLARTLAQTTLDEIAAAGAARVVTLTAGDTWAFRQMHRERLGLGLPDGVEVVEALALIDEAHTSGTLRFTRASDHPPYAYLDPTHAVRVPERFDAPRRLLEAITGQPGRELFFRRDRAHPCGTTAVQFTEPHIARHLDYSRLGDAQKTGAQVIVTEDPACLHRLTPLAPRFGLRVVGLYEALAEHIVE